MDRVEYRPALLPSPRSAFLAVITKSRFCLGFVPFLWAHDCALLFVRGGFSLHRRGYALKYLKVTSVTL